MKVISDEEMVCLSLSRVVQLFPRLSDGEWDCCADRAALPLPPPPPPLTDLLFSGNRDAKWMSHVSAAWRPFAA